jgi:sensor histidine kinase regulating citrate/malate metabolism
MGNETAPRREGVSMKLVAILGSSLAVVLGMLSTVLVLLVKSFVNQMEVQHKDNMAMQAIQHADNMASQKETREVLQDLGKKQQTLSETLRKIIDKKRAP